MSCFVVSPVDVLADLLDVSGIGQAKLEKYGQAFLDVLNRFALVEPAPGLA